MMRPVRALLAAIAVVAIPLALMGASVDVSRVVLPPGAAAIYNPGNADLGGFLIVIQPNGKAWAVDSAGQTSSTLGIATTQTFFTDLASVGPLGHLPTTACPALWPSAPSTSGTTAVAIYWNGQRSPDLNCVADVRAARLLADASAIQHALYIQAYRTRTSQNYGGGIVATGAAPTYFHLSSYAAGGGYAASAASSGAAYAGGYQAGYGGGCSPGCGGYTDRVDMNNVSINLGGRFQTDMFPNEGRFDKGSFSLNGRMAVDRFSLSRFTEDRFSQTRFDNGGQFSTGSHFDNSSSFGGRYGSLNTTSLPGSNVGHSLGSSNPGSSSPNGSGPYSSGPYSGGP